MNDIKMRREIAVQNKWRKVNLAIRIRARDGRCLPYLQAPADTNSKMPPRGGEPQRCNSRLKREVVNGNPTMEISQYRATLFVNSKQEVAL